MRPTHNSRGVNLLLVAALLALLSCCLVACNLPFEAASPAPPPTGRILYVLSFRVPATKQITASTPVALTVVALRVSSGQHLWQSSPISVPAGDFGHSSVTSGGATLYVSVSAPTANSFPGASRSAKAEIIALDAGKGHMQWRIGLDGKVVRSLTVAPDGNLYLDLDNQMEALNGSTGSHLWSATTAVSYVISKVVATRSAVYVEQEAYSLPGSEPNSTYDSAVVRALNLDSGRQIWRKEVANTNTNQLALLVGVSMQADDQAVYLLRVGQVPNRQGNVFGSVAHTTLFALHAEDGSPLWSDQTQTADAGMEFSLLLYGRTLYIAGAGTPSSLSALRSQSGQALWTWETPLVLNPFQPPNHIYGSSLNKGEGFCALQSGDGSKSWCSNYNQAGPVLFGGPGKICLVAFKITYQGTSETESPAQLYILNENDGSLVAQYSPGNDRVTQIQGIALS